MGQQESQAASAASVDHLVDGQFQPTHAGPGRGRMDKLFRRAQSTLESRMRGRERPNSPQSPSTTKHRRSQSASLRVSKPKLLLQSPGGAAIDDNDLENVSVASSVGSECSTVRTECDTPTLWQTACDTPTLWQTACDTPTLWQTACESPASVRLAEHAALENIPHHPTDSPSSRRGEVDLGTATGSVSTADGTATGSVSTADGTATGSVSTADGTATGNVSTADGTASKHSESLHLSTKSAFMLDMGHQALSLNRHNCDNAVDNVAQSLFKPSLPHIIVHEQMPVSQESHDNVVSSSPVSRADPSQWQWESGRTRGRNHSGSIEVNVSRPIEMVDYLAPKVMPEDFGLSPIEERHEQYSPIEVGGASSVRSHTQTTRENPRDVSHELDRQSKELVEKAFCSIDAERRQGAMRNGMSPLQSGESKPESEPNSSLSTPTDEVFVDAKSHLTEHESPHSSVGRDVNRNGHQQTAVNTHQNELGRSASLNHIDTENSIRLPPANISYPTNESGQNPSHDAMLGETAIASGLSSKRKFTTSETEISQGGIFIEKGFMPESSINRVRSVDSGLEGTTGRHVADIDDIRVDFSSIANDSVEKPRDPGGKVFTARYNTWVGLSGRDDNNAPGASRPDSLHHTRTRSLQNHVNLRGSNKRRRYGSTGGSEEAATREDEGGMWRPPSRSVSLEEMVKTPKTVPEKLNFRQLDKFEGKRTVRFFTYMSFMYHPLKP